MAYAYSIECCKLFPHFICPLDVIRINIDTCYLPEALMGMTKIYVYTGTDLSLSSSFVTEISTWLPFLGHSCAWAKDNFCDKALVLLSESSPCFASYACWHGFRLPLVPVSRKMIVYYRLFCFR